MHFRKVTLAGVGLLGGSLGLALRERKLADEVVGYVRRAASVVECETAGAVHHATLDIRQAVAGADLVVLCTPIAQMDGLVRQMAADLKKGAVVTDVGSVKGGLVKDLAVLVAKAGAHFVGSHPMAGSEKMGVVAAQADLFVNAVCVVTPGPNTSRKALHRVELLWKAVGARLLRMSPRRHDSLVAYSSHLPHLVAAQVANLVLSPEFPKQQATLCANGFRDTTRVASGSPEMWRDIALANRQEISRALARFIRELTRVQRSISAGRSDEIRSFLDNAKKRRDQWQGSAAGMSPE